MPEDFAFDPITRDLIDDGKGGFEMTSTAATMVMHQTWCHYNEWWGDETLGSKFHDLSAFQAKPEVMAPDEAKRAFGVIVARGRIANLMVVAQVQGPGRIFVQSTFRDVSTGQVVTTFATPGGK